MSLPGSTIRRDELWFNMLIIDKFNMQPICLSELASSHGVVVILIVWLVISRSLATSMTRMTNLLW